MEIEQKKRIIVGLNQFQSTQPESFPVLRIDPKVEQEQVERLKKLRARRDNKKVEQLRSSLSKAAQESRNLMPSIFESVKGYVTLGEIIETLEKVYGRYRPH